MSDVYFLDYAKGESVLQGMRNLFTKSSLADLMSPEKSTAIKLHMGELGNVTYIRPLFVRRVADLVKRAGSQPFVTDTTALYPGARGTAERAHPSDGSTKYRMEVFLNSRPETRTSQASAPISRAIAATRSRTAASESPCTMA